MPVDKCAQVSKFSQTVALICQDLVDGLFHQEIAEKHGVTIGVVRFVAEQVGWDKSWVKFTDVEEKIFDLLAQGLSLVDIRSNLGVGLEPILAISRRCGLDKRARSVIRSGRPLVPLNNKVVTQQEVEAEHRLKWAQALQLWSEGIPFDKIAIECKLRTSQLLEGVEEMRRLYGWFKPRPSEEAQARYELRRRVQAYARRRKWKPAEDLWDQGFSEEEIAASLGRDLRLVRIAIKTCQSSLGMFKPRKSFTISASSRSELHPWQMCHHL